MTNAKLVRHIRDRLEKNKMTSPAINISRDGWAKIIGLLEAADQAEDPIARRQAIERQIVERLIDDALAEGYTLDVYDGEETTVAESDDREAILAAMFSVDEERLYYRREGKRVGYVFLVYGNDGHDVISDSTTNLERVMAGAEALAESLAEQ